MNLTICFPLKHIPVRLFQMTVHHHSINIFYVKGELICFSFKGRSLICFFDSQEERGRQCRNLHRKFCIWFQFTEFRQTAFSSGFCIYFVAIQSWMFELSGVEPPLWRMCSFTQFVQWLSTDGSGVLSSFHGSLLSA